jgi:nucleotide-binding universal stress UspA family protein
MTTTLQLATPPPFAPAAVNAIFPRALLAIDFGSASLSAARWATTHVAPNTEAVLMHVAPFADESFSESGDTSAERLRPALTGGLGGFGATLSAQSRRNVVRVGRPSASLSAVANDTEASLLVLGRRADANRLRVGEPNVIERTARRTSASVLVVPEGAPHALDHIVAAVDESGFAPHVLAVASRLARMHEVPLTVVHVLSPLEGAYERGIRSSKHVIRVRGQRVEVTRPAGSTEREVATARWLAQLVEAYGVVGRDSTEVAIGDPAREIVATAADRESPLVIVGLRGADEAPRGSVGSVARELLTRGPMPVLAVNVML